MATSTATVNVLTRAHSPLFYSVFTWSWRHTGTSLPLLFKCHVFMTFSHRLHLQLFAHDTGNMQYPQVNCMFYCLHVILFACLLLLGDRIRFSVIAHLFKCYANVWYFFQKICVIVELMWRDGVVLNAPPLSLLGSRSSSVVAGTGTDGVSAFFSADAKLNH